MKIKTIEIKNFRLIEDGSLNLEDDITLIVGKNNSGKTSLVDFFFELLERAITRFQLTDFSSNSFVRFQDAYLRFQEYIKSQNDKEDEKIQLEKRKLIRESLPSINLNILIEYDKGSKENKGDNLENLREFITDLDENKNSAWICIEYGCTNELRLFESYEIENKKNPADIIDFMRDRLPAYYETKYYAGNKEKETYNREIVESPLNKITNVFLTRTVSAQRYFVTKSSEDTTSSNPNTLAGGFSNYYDNTNKDVEPVDKIKTLLKSTESDLEKEYNTLFKEILTDIKDFGAETPTKIPDVELLSKFDTEGVLKNNIKYFYKKKGVLLPEKNNGLGYNNLIQMVLAFASFFEEFKNKIPQSDFLLLFVEEPEAYMHPQMQQLFVRHITEYINKSGIQAQVIITSHSSHVIAESGVNENNGFDRIRYFDITTEQLIIKDFSELVIEGDDETRKKTIKFLKQYLQTQKCDLFFADYAMVVEGITEKVLLPFMINKSVPELNKKYISIIEVGGAYAHKFKELLEFLNVPTLIITDIDSIDISARRSACMVQVGLNFETSNQSIIKLLGKRKIEDLLVLKEESKIKSNIRVAYQISEVKGDKCGRSLEEAFLLKNISSFIGSDELNA
ncbi:MAG: AAA family ATPase, partial [Bacteroidales bacterium]|nr:AAA family ATPase [Bacteroidales bacterium]